MCQFGRGLEVVSSLVTIMHVLADQPYKGLRVEVVSYLTLPYLPYLTYLNYTG